MPTAQEWIEAFRLDWLDRGAGKPETWVREYQNMFKRLPQDVELTAPILHAAVINTVPNTRQRVRACLVFTALAKFAKIDYDAKRYRGNYQFDTSTKERHLPTDEAIAAYFATIQHPKWRWVFGMMATYGLRNHEVFFIDLDRLRSGDSVIKVLEGKTGPREVWPFHPEWFYEMECYRPLIPDIDLKRNHIRLGAAVTKYFKNKTKTRETLPFNPYDLRHRYAVRTFEYGLKTTLAAKQMGHRLEVHNRIYHQWISHDIHQKAYTEILRNPTRPKAPKIPQSGILSGT
jgi:hypothetical protein